MSTPEGGRRILWRAIFMPLIGLLLLLEYSVYLGPPPAEFLTLDGQSWGTASVLGKKKHNDFREPSIRVTRWMLFVLKFCLNQEHISVSMHCHMLSVPALPHWQSCEHRHSKFLSFQ